MRYRGYIGFAVRGLGRFLVRFAVFSKIFCGFTVQRLLAVCGFSIISNAVCGFWRNILRFVYLRFAVFLLTPYKIKSKLEDLADPYPMA